MTSLLITNDDGINAPALIPLATAMQELGDVMVAAPSTERSWIGKAISRHHPIEVAQRDHEGIPMWSVDGYPADCVQVGAFGLLDELPDFVISGINIGANKGSAFSTGSGTVAAAIEASNIGVPGIAFSAMSQGLWREWGPWAASADSLGMWTRLAGVAADIAATIIEAGFPPGVDALSVNLPADAEVATPRRITTLARTSYGALFKADDGVYRHDWDGVLYTDGDVAGSDLDALDTGMVSITPVRMANTAPLDEAFRRRVEQGGATDPVSQ